jgi:hypothetical protein
VAVTRRGLGVEGLIRVASVGAVAASVAFAAAAVAQHASEGTPRALPVAVGATVLALALHVRHLRYALIPRWAPGADHCSIVAAHANGLVRLEVLNDGVSPIALQGSGRRLTGIAERAYEVLGSASTERFGGGGFAFCVEIPEASA